MGREEAVPTAGKVQGGPQGSLVSPQISFKAVDAAPGCTEDAIRWSVSASAW
jgi:hypothetical protein